MMQERIREFRSLVESVFNILFFSLVSISMIKTDPWMGLTLTTLYIARWLLVIIEETMVKNE